MVPDHSRRGPWLILSADLVFSGIHPSCNVDEDHRILVRGGPQSVPNVTHQLSYPAAAILPGASGPCARALTEYVVIDEAAPCTGESLRTQLKRF
jgi:hypothetical protein